MTKRDITIVMLVPLFLVVSVFAGFKIDDIMSKKRMAQEDERRKVNDLVIEMAYEIQNKAFFDVGFPEYTPYNKQYEYALQINTLCYTRNTGKTITLTDVEVFLENSENTDGTPRTWEDDQTNIIKDFVNWCLNSNNRNDLASYRRGLERVFGQYLKHHLDCPYGDISELTPEQIIELDKKYLDPDYNLLLA